MDYTRVIIGVIAYLIILLTGALLLWADRSSKNRSSKLRNNQENKHLVQ